MQGMPEPGVVETYTCPHCDKSLNIPRFPGDRWLRVIARHSHACGATEGEGTIQAVDRALKLIMDAELVYWCYTCRTSHSHLLERCPKLKWPWEK